MVEYSKFVSLVFEQVGDSASATEIVSWAGSEWSKNKSDLQAATVTEVRKWLSQKL